jgi:hypothetical protein
MGLPLRFGSYRAFPFQLGLTIQRKNGRLTAAGGCVSKKPANKIARGVVWIFAAGGKNDARSIYSRTLKFHHSRSWAALQRPHTRGYSLVDYHAGFLDWDWRHVGMGLPHHRCLHSLLVR